MREISSPLEGIKSPLGQRRFSPAALFTAGEQGVWYDPSDFSTMFQDSAGTTPVTAVEQPVGLILDKSGRGNHASQSTSASRPVLSARYNLLTQTEDFSNAAWTKAGSSISTNAVVAPDGTTTADKIVESATTAEHLVSVVNIGTGQKTASVCFKAAERTQAAIYFFNATNGVEVSYFNLSNGTVVSGAGTISDLGNGWYRCSLTRTATVNDNVYFCAAVGGTKSYTGNGTSGIYIWGADLRVTNDGAGLPAYQRVAASTNYDTTGFPLYLRFDGTDDSLATASIDFSATDNMGVFAGVRKLSDAAVGVLVELSATVASNAGSFYISAPDAPGAYYGIRSGGSTRPASGLLASYFAPISNVITGIFDIGNDVRIARINGAQVNTSSADQGTGNFGNYPLYIGRRGGSTLPADMRLYSLIVRGAQSTDAQIASAEAWVNSKTRAY